VEQKAEELGDDRWNEGFIDDARSQADQNHHRKQTELGVCSTMVSRVTVRKRNRSERPSQSSLCIHVMDGRRWGDVTFNNVPRSLSGPNTKQAAPVTK
jgi:hypothetical protein